MATESKPKRLYPKPRDSGIIRRESSLEARKAWAERKARETAKMKAITREMRDTWARDTERHNQRQAAMGIPEEDWDPILGFRPRVAT